MVTNKELEQRLARVEARLATMEQTAELPELPELSAPPSPPQDMTVCTRCGHQREDHVPLSEQSCFVAGCKCRGFTTKKKRSIRLRFKEGMAR